MSNNDYQTPDLASILRSLAAATQQYQTTQQPPQHVLPQSGNPNVRFDNTTDNSTSHTLNLSEPEDEYDPSDPLLPLPSAPDLQSSRPSSALPKPHSLPTPPSQPVAVARVSTPSIDPRTITTYPAALRYITQNLASNQATIGRIRRLIASQHQHERQWWAGRELILKQQRDRERGKKMIDEVLKNIGGIVSAPVTGPTPEEEAVELSVYDRKVHRVCEQMAKATASELQLLGIPFFGTRSEFLALDNEVIPHGTKKLKWEELRELQRRVLRLLEDLCGE